MRQRARWPQVATLAALAFALGYLAWLGWGLLPQNQVEDRRFSGQRALTWAQAQCDIGPRPAGSQEAFMTADLIKKQLQNQGWEIREQAFDYNSVQLRNIVGMTGGGDGPVLIIATHYDTRLLSDRDADVEQRVRPTLGANDGASGVSVLLELARALDKARLEHRVWLVFLDGEANAGLPEWEGALGASELVNAVKPAGAIYLNRVGAQGARFSKSPDATTLFQDQFWEKARQWGFQARYLNEIGPAFQDAHTVFLAAGIPTVAIVQTDDPYFRTTEDTCDRLDATTLEAAGVPLEAYLEQGDFLTILPALKE